VALWIGQDIAEGDEPAHGVADHHQRCRQRARRHWGRPARRAVQGRYRWSNQCSLERHFEAGDALNIPARERDFQTWDEFATYWCFQRLLRPKLVRRNGGFLTV